MSEPWKCPYPAGCVQRRPHHHYLAGPGVPEEIIYEDEPAPEPSPAAPGWLLAAIVAATGTHDCPVCNAGRPLPDGVTCPLCAGWTTL